MADWRQLKAAVDELEALHRGLGEIVLEERDGWRLELVRRRRALSELVGRIATLLGDVDQQHLLSTQESLELRSKLTGFRSALAMHQASYPAVMIAKDNSEYRASAEAARTASAAFCRLVRQAFKIS